MCYAMHAKVKLVHDKTAGQNCIWILDQIAFGSEAESSWIQTLLHFLVIWEGLEPGLAKLPHLRDSSELYTTIGFSIGEEISEKPLQIFLCLLLTFLDDFFVTLLCLFLASFSSLFCHLLTFLDDFFVIALCSYFSPFSSLLSLTHFSEYFLCYERGNEADDYYPIRFRMFPLSFRAKGSEFWDCLFLRNSVY